MSAPRIDTFRNTMDAVVDLLAELRPDVEDVHDLAYNRPRAANEAKVKGGERDYALDTNGDMIARQLYIDVAAELVGLGRGAERALRALRRHLNKQATAFRRDESANVTAAEFTQAVYARARRTARGEHHPFAQVSQPTRPMGIDPIAELDHLRNAVRRMAGRYEAEHRDCKDERGKRKTKRFDRSLLSQAERSAWDRAFLVGSDRSAAS